MVAPMPTFPGSGYHHMVGHPHPSGYPSTGILPYGNLSMGVAPQSAPHMIPHGAPSQASCKFDSIETSCCPPSQVEYRELLVEVPEVQIVEKLVEVAQKVQQEKVVHVPKVEVVERKVQVPKYVVQEKIVQVPQIQYIEVPVEKVVEVPEVQTRVIMKEIDVPVNVDLPIIQPRQAPLEQEIQRNIPMPIDVMTIQSYEMPKLKPLYKEVPVPIYVPRYIEVPIPAQFAAGLQPQQISRLATQCSGLALGPNMQPMMLSPQSTLRHMSRFQTQNASRRESQTGRLSAAASRQISGVVRQTSASGRQISDARHISGSPHQVMVS